MMLDLSLYFPPQPLPITEVVAVVVDGRRYTAIERFQVRAGYNEAARAFEFTVAAELGASVTNAVFHAGAQVDVFAGGDLLVSGYVDQKRPHLSARRADISVTGRSKGADIIDSDIDHPTGYFEKKSAIDIAKELAKGYPAKFVSKLDLKKLPQHIATPGATIFREVERLMRRHGVTMTGLPNGDISITKPDGSRHVGGIIEGQNLLVGNADHNWSNRHSKYDYRGQRTVGRKAKRLHMVASAKDSAVARKRVKSQLHESNAEDDDLKERAKTRALRSAGAALKASISVPGFRDQAGLIWTPGFLVWTESPYLDIAQDMLIESVDLSQSEQGTIAMLSLVDPKAYASTGAGGGKGSKSGKEWAQDVKADPPTDDVEE